MWTARQMECWLLINSSSLWTWSHVQERIVLVQPTLIMYIFRNLFIYFLCLYFPKHTLLLLLVATYAVVLQVYLRMHHSPLQFNNMLYSSPRIELLRSQL